VSLTHLHRPHQEETASRLTQQRKLRMLGPDYRCGLAQYAHGQGACDTPVDQRVSSCAQRRHGMAQSPLPASCKRTAARCRITKRTWPSANASSRQGDSGQIQDPHDHDRRQLFRHMQWGGQHCQPRPRRRATEAEINGAVESPICSVARSAGDWSMRPQCLIASG
jgi:hypothetical protein